MVKKIDEFNAGDRIGVTLLDNHVHFLIGDIETENINDTIKWLVYENLDKKQEKTDGFHGLRNYGVTCLHFKKNGLWQNTAQKISRVHTH
jgi:hypothetical protein